MDDAVDAAILGSCPDCGGEIPPERLLARYLTEDERARVLAECPDCAGIGPPVDDVPDDLPAEDHPGDAAGGEG